MKKYINIWMIVALIVAFSSCKNDKDFLTLQPLSEYSDASVWKSIELMDLYVNGMYRGVNGVPFNWMMLSVFADESNSANDAGSVLLFNQCLMTPDNLQGWEDGNWSYQSQHFRWRELYSEVRKTNVFFSKISQTDYPEVDKDKLSYLKGQVYFLRAGLYHILTSLYGGVPIITKPYELNDDYSILRNSYEECINFITGQLDSAAMYLPLENSESDLGRATKGAAMALKARVLLYAASDLHHKQSVYASTYSNPELLGYIGGDNSARWRAAKDAAKAVMDLNLYSLYKADPSGNDSVAQNIAEYFLTPFTQEDILVQYTTIKTVDYWGYNVGLFNGMNGWHCWGGNAPLADFVDDYEMKDGTTFDWNNPAHKDAPYANRDARFYATVFYDGCSWRPRPTDIQATDPWNKVQSGAVVDPDGNILQVGVDTRQGPIESWNGSWTNYYLRKFMDPAVDGQYNQQVSIFRHIRYAEVLLNYAEACIELGQDAEAREYINQIRHRAGQPDLPSDLTGDALRVKYRHERKIELAFEQHRFFDVRRWIIGPEAYHQMHAASVKHVVETTNDDKDFTKFFVSPVGYTGSRVDKYRKDDGSDWGKTEFSSVVLPADPRSWKDNGYFFPILRDEINKNTKLIQNPGYN